MSYNENELGTVVEEWRDESTLSDVTKNEIEEEALKQFKETANCNQVIPSIWLYEKLVELEEKFLQ